MSNRSSLIGSRSSKAIYGIILITAVLISFEKYVNDPLEVAIKLLFAAFAIVLAEVYSEFLGEKIKKHKTLLKSERKEITYDALAILSVSLYPALIFLISYAGLLSVDAAFRISYFLSMVSLGIFAYVASMHAGESRVNSVIRASVAVMIGTAIIVIKYQFGH